MRDIDRDLLPNLADERPTGVRYGVLSFLGALAFVLYLDRICIGQAQTSMMRELDISNSQWAWVSNAFIIPYTLFEVPTGHWGDRYGSRRVLLRIVLWWSVFTALTGAVQPWIWTAETAAINLGLWALVAVRFLFGAGEAGAFPNSARVIAQWFPISARGRAQGVITTCSLIGGALAPVASAYLITRFGWRSTFIVFGSLGIVWAAAFAAWFRDRPEDHPGVNDAERRLILDGREPSHSEHPPIPWDRVLSSPNVWLMGTIMSCGAGVFYVLFTWFATYLKSARQVSETDSGWMTSLVMAGGAVGCFSGGFLTDRLVRLTGERTWSRRMIGVGAFFLTGASILAGIRMDNPWLCSACFAVTFFCVQLQVPSWWSVVTEISGPHVGAMFGLMNSLGGVGAIGATTMLGVWADRMKTQGLSGRPQWDPAFDYIGCATWVGCLCWLCVRPHVSIVAPPAPATQEPPETPA